MTTNTTLTPEIISAAAALAILELREREQQEDYGYLSEIRDRLTAIDRRNSETMNAGEWGAVTAVQWEEYQSQSRTLQMAQMATRDAIDRAQGALEALIGDADITTVYSDIAETTVGATPAPERVTAPLGIGF